MANHKSDDKRPTPDRAEDNAFFPLPIHSVNSRRPNLT